MGRAKVLRVVVGKHQRTLRPPPARKVSSGLDHRVANHVKLLKGDDVDPELGPQPEGATDVTRATDEKLKTLKDLSRTWISVTMTMMMRMAYVINVDRWGEVPVDECS